MNSIMTVNFRYKGHDYEVTGNYIPATWATYLEPEDPAEFDWTEIKKDGRVMRLSNYNKCYEIASPFYDEVLNAAIFKMWEGKNKYEEES